MKQQVTKLHNIHLHNISVVNGVFFSKETEGLKLYRLHDKKSFYGYANEWHTPKRGRCYRVTYWLGDKNRIVIKKVVQSLDHAIKELGRGQCKIADYRQYSKG